MNAPSCQLYPEVAGGEISKLYVDLLSLIGDRTTTNLIYASYLQSGVAAHMDSLGLSQNKQGQHKAKDVYNFFDVDSILEDRNTLESAKASLGAIDSSGNPIPITNPVEALKKVKAFNDTHKGLVATIYYDGIDHWFSVYNRDSLSIGGVDNVNKNIRVWTYLEALLNTNGINAEDVANNNLAKNIIDPSNAIDIYRNLENIKNTDLKYLDGHNIAAILLLNSNDLGIIRVLNLFGGDRARAIEEIRLVLAGRSTLSSSEKGLINRAISRCKLFPNIDINNLKNETLKIIGEESSLTPNQIVETIKDLNDKFKINKAELIIRNEHINTLEQATLKALNTLTKRERELRNKTELSNEQAEELNLLFSDMSSITKNIEKGKYVLGCIKFLDNANDKLNDINFLLDELTRTLPTEKETAFHRARVIHEIDSIFNGYREVLDALANINKLTSITGVTRSEAETIKNRAEEILKTFDRAGVIIDRTKQEVMADILKLILGTTSQGKSVTTLLKEANLDTDFWDKLNSFARSSNDLVAAMGTITRNAQLKRNEKFKEIERRIREADIKLRKNSPIGKSGTSFMFEADKKHIISDIDWNKYENEKEAYRQSLINANTPKHRINFLVKKWEMAHKSLRVVDNTNGRTELVPNDEYRKPFPNLTPAQQEYYDTMMQIKGEMESLIPDKGRNYYRPPQVRRSLGDVLFNSKSPIDAIRGIGTRIKDTIRFEEGSEMDASNGIIIDGEDSYIERTNYKGEPLKEIPIFHIKELKRTSELMTDLSSSLQSEAASCINYDCMEEVVDVVEFMRDYIADNITPIKSKNGSGVVDARVTNDAIIVQKTINEGKAKGVLPLIQSYMEMQFYGEVLKTNGKWESRIAPIILKSIGYSSIKSLALNLKGIIANGLMGEAQALIEACGAEFFNPKDYIWANAKIFGLGIKGIFDPIIPKSVGGERGAINDFFMNDRTSYSVLISDFFNIMPGEFRELKNKRYFRNPIRALFGNISILAGYGIGEHLIHHVVGYSILHNIKVLIPDPVTGEMKKDHLYNAFEKIGKDAPTLKLKDGVTDRDGNIIDNEFLDHVKRIILYCNQMCHGGMTDEEKGVFAQQLLGRSALNFRQWMIETYNRRYAGTHFDGTIGEHRTGYYDDIFHLIQNVKDETEGINVVKAIREQDITPKQAANLRRGIAAMTMTLALFGLSFWLWPDDDEEEEARKKMLPPSLRNNTEERSVGSIMGEYQYRKVMLDFTATDLPLVGIALTARTLMQSPLPVLKTMAGWTYPFYGVVAGDFLDELVYPNKHKDKNYDNLPPSLMPPKEPENVWWHRTKAWALPFIKDIEEILYFDKNVLRVFGEEQMFR